MSTCTCPITGALPTIPVENCPTDFGQIQRIAFQRIASGSEFVAGEGSTANPITKKSSWDDFMSISSSDTDKNNKISITPVVSAPTMEGGDERTFGGGNETPGGVEISLGANASNLNVVLRQFSQATIKTIKQLMCEKKLGVYFINGAGQILARKTTSGHAPIPAQSVFVGDWNLGGFETPDSNPMRIGLPEGWSDDAEIVTPEFNALDL